jgi:hypothetical protein
MSNDFLPEELLKSLGRAFRKRILRLESKNKRMTPSGVGTDAQNWWLNEVLIDHTGFTVRGKLLDPITDISRTGDPYRFDVVATVAGQRVLIELKKSDYRDDYQLKAQLLCLAINNPYRARALYKFCGDGKIYIWTREDAEKAFNDDKQEVFTVPKPTKTLDYVRRAAPVPSPYPNHK